MSSPAPSEDDLARAFGDPPLDEAVEEPGAEPEHAGGLGNGRGQLAGHPHGLIVDEPFRVRVLEQRLRLVLLHRAEAGDHERGGADLVDVHGHG